MKPHCVILVALLGACMSEEDDNRDTPIEGPLEFDEPVDVAEPDMPDEPEVTAIEASTGDHTIVTTLRVLHWNIAGGKVHDCKTADIAAAVRRIVRDHDIHLVGLNEVCPDQYDAIRRALREQWGKAASAKFSAYVGDGKARIVGNAIFSKRNLDQNHAQGARPRSVRPTQPPVRADRRPAASALLLDPPHPR